MNGPLGIFALNARGDTIEVNKMEELESITNIKSSYFPSTSTHNLHKFLLPRTIYTKVSKHEVHATPPTTPHRSPHHLTIHSPPPLYLPRHLRLRLERRHRRHRRLPSSTMASNRGTKLRPRRHRHKRLPDRPKLHHRHRETQQLRQCANPRVRRHRLRPARLLRGDRRHRHLRDLGQLFQSQHLHSGHFLRRRQQHHVRPRFHRRRHIHAQRIVLRLRNGALSHHPGRFQPRQPRANGALQLLRHHGRVRGRTGKLPQRHDDQYDS